ncbi:uncharacterized protein LOC111788851 [Cucurbita pepo subsp. pepo]|uniref:uncharacterized protein LOC111788851 n=1 Tax=Cucurbita pepo subsp. pepo TaxID=3664 RepID=UPI000C9D448D|nr:uncharacterized protein LOC111788851 [Cucurbita pepo subsp. pepo]
MDLPPFLYHQRDQSRYISPPPPPPPSSAPLPHPFFPDDPNFHFPSNHHQVLHNIPDKGLDFPLRPPPPPPSYRHPPIHPPPSQAPPLGYNPSQPHFVVSSSIHDDQLRSPHPIREFPRSPPLSSRVSFEGGFHRDFVDLNHSFHETRFDVSDPSRGSADNRPSIPHSPIDFQHGAGHREIDYRSVMPYPPPDMFRYSSGSSSRRGAEYNDRFQTNPREEVLRGRGEENYYHHDQLKADSNITFMESGAMQSPLSRDNKFTSGSFDKHRYGSNYEKESFRSRRNGNVVGKNQRWVHSKQTFRNMHNSYSDGSNDRGYGDRSDFRIMSGKHGHSNPESGKYYGDNKDSIEGYNEYTSTPRKQVQKKSAFLRIQMANPCHSNRESEQLHDSDYFDEKNGFHRGKNQVRSQGYRIDAGKKRQGSPMELDVSFKSNSLVAKAIVTPTQSAPTSHMDKMPGYEKTTNVLVPVPHHNSTDLHLTGKNKDDLGTNDVTNPAPCPPGSKNELKKSEEKATGWLAGNGSNNLTDASLVKGNYSLRKTNVERPSQGMVSGIKGRNAYGKVATVRTMKKKKVVRKVVKKVGSPRLYLQTRNSNVDPLKACSLKNIPPVAENKSSTSGMNSDHGSVLKASQHGMSGSLDNGKADQSVLPLTSEEFQANTDMGMECVPADDSNKNNFDSPLNPLIKEARGSSNQIERNSSFISVPPLLNSNKDLKLSNGPNDFDFECQKSIKPKLCGNEEDLSLENVYSKGSKSIMFSLGSSQSGIVSSNDPNISDNLVNGNSLAVNKDVPMDFDNGGTQVQDNTSLCETCFADGICQQCANRVTGPPETDVVGVSAAKVTISNSLVGVNPEASEMQIDSKNLQDYNSGQHTNQDSDVCRQCTNIRVNEVLNCERIGSAMRESKAMDSSVSLGISSVERSAKAKVSISGGQGEKSLSKMSKIKNCLDFAGSCDINQETNSEDLCVRSNSKNYCPSEQGVSGDGSIIIDVNPTTTEESPMPDFNLLGKSSKNKLSMGFDVNNRGNEIKSRKKRKICIASPVLPCPSVESNEGPALTVISSLNDQLTSNVELMEGEEVAASTVDAFFKASPVSTDCSKGISKMLDEIPKKENSKKINIDDGPFEYCLKYEQPENSRSIREELIVSKCQPLSSLGNEKEDSSSSTMAPHQRNDMDVVICRRKELNIHAEAQSMLCNKTAQWNSPQVPSSQTLNFSYPEAVKASCNLGQDNVHHIERCTDGGSCLTANSDNEIIGIASDTQGDLGSPETSNVQGIDKLHCEVSLRNIDFKMDCEYDKKVKEKSSAENELRASNDTSFPQPTTINQKLGCTNSDNNLTAGKVVPRALVEFKSGLQADNHSANSCKKNQNMVYHKYQTIPGKSFSTCTASKKIASDKSFLGTKPRSWHRNVNTLVPAPGNAALSSTIPSQGQLHGGDGMLESTLYIRKGNSLVRKPSPVAARVSGSHDLSSSSSDQHDCRPNIKSNGKVEVANPPVHFKVRGTDVPIDKPFPPQLSSGSGSPNHPIPNADYAPSPCHEPESNLTKSKHVSDLSRSVGDPSKIFVAPKSLVGTADKKEHLTEKKDKNFVSSVVKKMVYVKRKSNQLVATSKPCNLSTKNMETTCSLASDGYYKRKKNQLIRASSECQMKQTSLPTEDILNPGGPSSYGDGDARSFDKRQQYKAVVKTYRPSKSSLVWTLRSSVAPGIGGGNLQNHKMAPRLFPWKRSHWKTFKLNASTQRNSSFSIVRKLLLMRNRNTVYKRSKHGFSLRKSKVLSIGRSSLKWSKSIEKHSKKANEEATRAVADVERKKRERNLDASISSDAPGGNQFSYDQASGSTTLQPKKSAKKFFIPRSLMIGNDEYVKIGNGNQLVRNTKRRARILANEKIRWSLHTARQRLAKKRKYCQFFTRFGKCNKEGGKCPYIHDTSKIAVCTKFLNGLCSNASCKLTHKVIPERMPDCSYFLQGLCSSKNCAYRHVNVNSKAPTCQAFLRGYCALGNECRKKHSYVCPLFEATGTCPDRPKCKLHHPKRQTKGRKRKRSEGKNNDQGRYFGSKKYDVSGSRMVVSEKHPVKLSDPFPEKDLADYISLDVSSDEDIAESPDSTSLSTSFCEGYLSELLLNNPDKLIKPVRIMTENLTMQSLAN